MPTQTYNDGVGIIAHVNDTTMEAVRQDPEGALQQFRRENVMGSMPKARFVNLIAESGIRKTLAQNVMNAYTRFVTTDPLGLEVQRELFYEKLKVNKASTVMNFHDIDFNAHASIPKEQVYLRNHWDVVELTIQKNMLKDATSSIEGVSNFVNNMVAQRKSAWTARINEIARQTIGNAIQKGNAKYMHISNDLSTGSTEGMIADIIDTFKKVKQDNRYSLAGTENAASENDSQPVIITTTRLSAQLHVALANTFHMDSVAEVDQSIIEDNAFLKYVSPDKRKGIQAIVMDADALNIVQTDTGIFEQQLPLGTRYSNESRQWTSYVGVFQTFAVLTTDEAPLRIVPEDAGYIQVFDDQATRVPYVYDAFNEYDEFAANYDNVKIEIGTVDDGKFNPFTSTARNIGAVSIALSTGELGPDEAISIDVKNISVPSSDDAVNGGDGAVAGVNLALNVTTTKGTGDSAVTKSNVSTFKSYYTLRTRSAQTNFGTV